MNIILIILLAISSAVTQATATKKECAAEQKSAVSTNPDPKDLKKHLKTDTLVIIMIQASWCGSCIMFKPIFEKAAQENSDIIFVSIDYKKADLLTYLAPNTGDIKAVPSVFFFKNGTIVETFVGYKNEPQFKALLKKHLSKSC